MAVGDIASLPSLAEGLSHDNGVDDLPTDHSVRQELPANAVTISIWDSYPSTKDLDGLLWRL